MPTPKYYQPCQRFMERGGFYGRSLTYPHTAAHTRHIFSTCIHLRYGEYDFTRASENVRVFNAQTMVPMFAYELRPAPPPPRPRKQLPDIIDLVIEWRQAA